MPLKENNFPATYWMKIDDKGIQEIAEGNFELKPIEAEVPEQEEPEASLNETLRISLEMMQNLEYFVPIKILRSGRATIVFWKDGTKTVVKAGEDTVDDNYAAFTAALAIKLLGSNSKLKRTIRNRLEVQE